MTDQHCSSSQVEPFTWPVRVYIEDTDAGGIVYHGNYLNYMERARTELLRTLGFGKAAVQADGALIVVTEAKLKYHRAATLDDLLQVRTRLVSLKRVTAMLEQVVYLGEHRLVTGLITIAAVNPATMRPIAIPKPMYTALGTVLVDDSPCISSQ